MKQKGLQLVLSLCASLFLTSATAQPANIDEVEALKLGTQAYIYGYPLVTMDTTRKVMTNVPVAQGMRAPMGQFCNAREYPTAAFKDVTAPNADTLYSVAWLDLSKEPYVLHLPDEKDRYYLMPLLSAWTDVFAIPGKRTTGTKPHDFIIAGPQWQGKLPFAISVLKSPTNMVWVLGRTYSTGTPEDLKEVHAIQNGYKLTPLSSYGKAYTPPKGTVDPNVDMTTPVRTQVNNMNAATYFKKFAELLKENPPTKADLEIVDALSKLGIVAGTDFDISKLPPTVSTALEKAVLLGQEQIMAHEKDADIQKNGWRFFAKTGIYGTDYLQRAYIAAVGLGANRIQDAVYPMAVADSTGKKLNGSNRYKIHYAKGETPPVKGFWSLTMYNSDMFFVDNPLNRYTLSPRNNLTFNQDGSLDLYIQHDSPGKDKESNWLPAPEGDFNLMQRFYWPDEVILKGTWSPPAVEMVK